MAELGGAHVLREQPIERALSTSNSSTSPSAHGRLSPVGAEQTHLPERLAAAHRPQDADVARLGILVLDLHAAAHDVEGVGTVPLPEDRLARIQDPRRIRPARSESTSSGRSSNAGSASISSCGFHAPRRLELEPERADQRPDPAPGRLARFKRPRTTGPARKAARSSSRIRDQRPPSQRAPTREPKICFQKKYAVQNEKIVNAIPATAYAPSPHLWSGARAPGLVPEVVLDELEGAVGDQDLDQVERIQ